MSKYFFLKVKEVIRETEDAVTIHFWHPINELVQYKPGQFLTILHPQEDGKKIRRSYSLSSSPFTDVSPAITVKQIPGGKVSTFLTQEIKVGDSIEVMEPLGTFTVGVNSERQRHYVLVGAGSGITPLISIAKSVLIVEPDSTVHLVYGSRNESSIILKGQIDELKAKYEDRFIVDHFISQNTTTDAVISGRITSETFDTLLANYPAEQTNQAHYYLCGPDEMMHDIKGYLQARGITNIFQESFLTATNESVTTAPTEVEGGSSYTIEMRYEGEVHHLEVGAHQTILEAAMENEIDLPYSCQAGMCTACLGRVIDGKVDLDEYDALSEAEIKEGFILTCVAHPKSSGVVVEID